MYDYLLVREFLSLRQQLEELFQCLQCLFFDPISLTAFFTFLLAIATFVLAFRDPFLSCINRPRLKIHYENKSPYCINIQKIKEKKKGKIIRRSIILRSNSYYFRFGVINEGKRPAENVEVYAEKLFLIQNEKPIERKEFIPMNLLWQDHNKCVTLSILHGMERLCNLGHIIDPKKRKIFDENPFPPREVSNNNTVLFIEVETKLNTKTHIIGPGIYELHIFVGASNADPRREKIRFCVTGKWYTDETLMYTDGMIIQEI
jgi:hypothetical protein